MAEYAVIRSWLSRHGKRRYQIAVGPYPTRSRALGAIDKYVNEYGYWDRRDEFSVALWRRPEHVAAVMEVA